MVAVARKRSAKARPKNLRKRATKTKTNWRPNRSSSEMSDNAVRRTSLYRTLRSLNTDLSATDVMGMARENIERKWAVIQEAREAVKRAAEEAQEAEEQRQERKEALQELKDILDAEDGHVRVNIQRYPAGWPGVTLRVVEEPEDRRIPLIQRLEVWMKAAEGEDEDGDYLPRFWPRDVATLVGCAGYQTVDNWLSGRSRQPQRVHTSHLRAMMEDYTYGRLRRMLQYGEKIT